MAARIPGNVRRPIVPIIATVGSRSIETYALLDTGANCDAIVPFLVRELDMQVRTGPRNLIVFGGEKTTLKMCDLADFEVSSFESKVSVSVRGALVSEILTTANDRAPSNEDIEGLVNMEGVVSFRELESELIGVILSAKHVKTWTGGEVISGGPNQMLALKTDFGWTLMGVNAAEESDEDIFNSYIIENEHEVELQHDINRMFRHDFLYRPGFDLI